MISLSEKISPFDFSWQDLISITIKAGQEISEYYRRDQIKIDIKSDDSPVTEADLAANQLIIDALEKITPDVPIVSEESNESESAAVETIQSSKQTWLVDPLDGTKDFIGRTDDFTVNIALISAGSPILGFVYAPARDLLFFCSKKCRSLSSIK